MNILKEIKIVHSEAEKEYGYPLIQSIWDIIEADVGNKDEYLDGDPEGEAAYIESYRNVTDRYVEVLKTAQPSVRVNPSTGAKGEPSQPKKKYRKCFERRFYIIEFVVEKGLNQSTHRIDWKRTVKEWNKTHRSDPMGLAVLKTEYYRAFKEAPLIMQFIITNFRKSAETSWRLYYQTAGTQFSKKFSEDYQEFRKLAENAILYSVKNFLTDGGIFKEEFSSRLINDSLIRLRWTLNELEPIK